MTAAVCGRIRSAWIAVDNWTFSFRTRLGFLLRTFRRRSKPAPSLADISSVRIALTLALGSGDALTSACRAALADMKAAGISMSTTSSAEHSSLVAMLSSTAGVGDCLTHGADRELRRLGIR